MLRISVEKMPVALIHALALTKKAAAGVNMDLGLLPKDYENYNRMKSVDFFKSTVSNLILLLRLLFKPSYL